MKVYENVLSEETLNFIRDERVDRFKSTKWSVSDLCWGNGLKSSSNGTVVQSYISEELEKRIVEDLGDVFPKCGKKYYMHYIWLANSGISLHDDSIYVFSATIYLNKNWNMDNGGLFIYEDGDEYKALCPKQNVMVVNDTWDKHMVTSVSPFAHEPRHTLQIWGIP